ncbi:hypothetical protein EDB86DRAFT_2839165 [Lactarius hatsudake]|nr:hypothetical protein EDB86DRAFT_2839165 [Lactarius hatsudake]
MYQFGLVIELRQRVHQAWPSQRAAGSVGEIRDVIIVFSEEVRVRPETTLDLRIEVRNTQTKIGHAGHHIVSELAGLDSQAVLAPTEQSREGGGRSRTRTGALELSRLGKVAKHGCPSSCTPSALPIETTRNAALRASLVATTSHRYSGRYSRSSDYIRVDAPSSRDLRGPPYLDCGYGHVRHIVRIYSVAHATAVCITPGP